MSNLLAWCARKFVAGDAAGPPPRLADLSDEQWGTFIRDAIRHSVMPITWRTLADVEGVPPVVAADLKTAFDANAVRNLRLAGDLVMVSRALDASGVESVTWKGPLLAQRAYGDLSLRQFFDLDLLVRGTDLDAAVRTLSSLGFEPQLDLDERQRSTYVAHMGELELVRESDGQWVELHTAVVPSYFGQGRYAEDLWDRVGTIRLARAEVRALDAADELEALCVHGSKHLWERLAWIVDIGLLGRLLDADDWRRLTEGSRERGTRRMVHTALALAVAVCGAHFPVDVMAGVRTDRAALRLAALARRRLFDADAAGRLDELRFHVQMWDSPSDRVRYVANVLLTPSVADWQFISLPAALEPLYPLVRPVRMVRDALRGIAPREPIGGAHSHR